MTKEYLDMCEAASRLAGTLSRPENPYVLIHEGLTALVVDGRFDDRRSLHAPDLEPAITLLPQSLILGCSDFGGEVAVMFIRCDPSKADWYFSAEAREKANEHPATQERERLENRRMKRKRD